MQQKWWLFAAGGVGIALAVLLFPRPNTGDSTPPVEPATAQPINVKEEPPRRVLTRPGGRDMAVRSGKSIDGPNPIARAAVERRDSPPGLFASRATGPWTMLRRELMLMEGDSATDAAADEIRQLILDLREVRRDPSPEAFNALAERQHALVAKVREQPSWLDNDTISISIERVEGYLAEYASETRE